MSAVSRSNSAWVNAVKANDVKKARRALVRLIGAVDRNLVKKIKDGANNMKYPHGAALRNARDFDRSAMRKARKGIDLTP